MPTMVIPGGLPTTWHSDTFRMLSLRLASGCPRFRPLRSFVVGTLEPDQEWVGAQAR